MYIYNSVYLWLAWAACAAWAGQYVIRKANQLFDFLRNDADVQINTDPMEHSKGYLEVLGMKRRPSLLKALNPPLLFYPYTTTPSQRRLI